MDAIHEANDDELVQTKKSLKNNLFKQIYDAEEEKSQGIITGAGG